MQPSGHKSRQINAVHGGNTLIDTKRKTYLFSTRLKNTRKFSSCLSLSRKGCTVSDKHECSVLSCRLNDSAKMIREVFFYHTHVGVNEY